MNKKGKLVVMSAPSGAGKSTICEQILGDFRNLKFSVSYTTRKVRGDEKDGVDYFFISKDEFTRKIDGGFWIEWAKVHDNYYGTSIDYIDGELVKGFNILLDIDVAGAIQILDKFPESVTIFIMPPDIAELRERLTKRGTDSIEIIEKRVKNAGAEMAKKDLYKYIVVNDDLDTAVNKTKSILEKELV